MRDGHEPNEAEEQRPCCVPIEPVHVISSPKDRREQEGYQNSGSFGENSWGDFAGVNPLSFAGSDCLNPGGSMADYVSVLLLSVAPVVPVRSQIGLTSRQILLRHPSGYCKHLSQLPGSTSITGVAKRLRG